EDGRLRDTVPKSCRQDMKAAVGAAVAAAERARHMSAHERMSVLLRASEILECELEDFARTIATEGIKTIREARKEVARAAVTLRLSSEEARRLAGETVPFDQMPGSEGRVGYYLPEPVGVIGAITPFNDPLNLVAHKVGPALAAGNAVVLKPDSKTPLSALKLARALQQAGLPDNLLQVVTGNGSEVGNALVEDERVGMISFTGGRATGEAIIRRGGLKKFSMELGSNAPVLIMNDADLDAAVPANVSGAYWAAGQNCLHVQRLLVQEETYDEFKARFVAGANARVVGPKLDEATDMGPLISEEHARKVEAMVDEALAAGATLLAGGTRRGSYYAPTVLEGVPEHCSLAREEVYGPVSVLSSFSNLQEAVRQANAVEYGLQAAIFTRDLATAFAAVKGLRYGGVMVNDSTDYRIDAMPFGGVKGSGLGREGVRFAVQEMTEPKLVCFNLA
ncbi:MAG TPA: aldehyde dehydrogenase family protein, partial [Trueperaceae bacterium]